MKTLLHAALEQEHASGLLSAGEFIKAYKAANRLFSLPFESPERSAYEHEAKFQEAAKHLHEHGPLILHCDYEAVVESPRWQLGKSLLGIPPEGGMAPLSQLEAIIVWMAFAQEKKLPLSHYVTHDGHRMLVWNSRTITFDAYAVNGKITEHYRSRNYSPVLDASQSSYLPAYYAAITTWQRGHRKEAKRILETIIHSNGSATQDPYVLSLAALSLLKDGAVDKSILKKAARMLVRSLEKFPKPDTCALIAELMIHEQNFTLAERVLERAIGLTLYDQAWACKLYAILAIVRRAAGNEEGADNATQLSEGRWRPVYRSPF